MLAARSGARSRSELELPQRALHRGVRCITPRPLESHRQRRSRDGAWLGLGGRVGLGAWGWGLGLGLELGLGLGFVLRLALALTVALRQRYA